MIMEIIVGWEREVSPRQLVLRVSYCIANCMRITVRRCVYAQSWAQPTSANFA